MNDFMRKGDPSVGIYELTAVLIHCGVSAYSGHYVAHILDRKVCAINAKPSRLCILHFLSNNMTSHKISI